MASLTNGWLYRWVDKGGERVRKMASLRNRESER